MSIIHITTSIHSLKVISGSQLEDNVQVYNKWVNGPDVQENDRYAGQQLQKSQEKIKEIEKELSQVNLFQGDSKVAQREEELTHQRILLHLKNRQEELDRLNRSEEVLHMEENILNQSLMELAEGLEEFKGSTLQITKRIKKLQDQKSRLLHDEMEASGN